MAQRDKYDFQQISQDWGAVEYKDVPSYSKTSVGTTGDAYLIRQFLKQFFPFLKTTVNKGNTSVRVKVQEIEINFISQQGGVRTNFLLNAAKLDEILGPLFEGQGFDGMTDSSYSKPLPKMYNDEGFEVSYGYIYLFVDPENFKYRYTIDLNTPDKTKKQDVLVFRSEVAGDGSQLKIELPLKTYNYIRNEINNTISNTASPTTNQSDSVILERGEENPNPQEYLVFQAENVLKLLNRGTALSLSEMDKFLTIPRYTIEDCLVDLLRDEYVVIVDKNKKRQKYEITQKGKNYLENEASKIKPSKAQKSNSPSQYNISSLGQAIVDFLAENTMYVLEALLNELTFNKKFRREDILDEVKELIQNGLVSAQMKNGYTVYVLTSEGSRYVDEDKYYTVLKQLILDFLAAKKGSKFATKSFIITQIRDNNSIYSEFEIVQALNELVEEELIGNKIIQGYESYFILPKASSDFIKKQNPLISKDPNDMDMEKSSEGEKAMSLFVAKNLDILKDMEQNAPELLDVLSKGLQLITNLGKGNTAELAPFTPLKNQQELEDQLKEEDFDISESDLSELDLTGLEDDLELNDDELGNLDLTEFDELTDFVNTELIPSKEARDYAVLKTVQLKSVVNNSITTNEILTSLNDRAEEKYTDQNILDLEQRDFLYKSNGWNLTTKGEEFIDEYELKNKQDSVAYPLINSQKKIDIDNLDIYQKEIIRVLSPYDNDALYPTLTVVQIFEKIDNNFKFTYRVIDARADLEILKIMGLVEEEDQVFSLVMSDKVKEVVEKLNEENRESREFSDLEKSILLSQRRGTESSFTDIFDSVEKVALQKFQLNTSYLNLREKLEAIEKLVEDGYLNKIVSSAYGNAYILTEKGEAVVEKLIEEKSENEKLTPTKQAILRDLFRMNMPLSASDIKEDVAMSENLILTVSMVFDKLSELKNAGYVNEINTQNLGIQWKLTPLGDEYVRENSKTGGEYREEKKRQKIEEDFGSLDYDYYLVAKILNDTMGMLTAGTVTTILQQKFNKKPKWQEVDVLLKLRSLKKYGLALEDIQNSTEYFEISAYGEDVVEYLSEQESKGLYPKSKPTQQTVAVRPSPTESATLNAVGTIKKGNDGNNWEVKESSKGVKRWVKMK